MQYDPQSSPDLPESGDDTGLAERFEKFHELNPRVYDLLVTLARRYQRATGEETQSIQRVIEIARWDEKIRTRGESDFLINNDYAAFYARLIMLQEPGLSSAFRLRKSHEADNWIGRQLDRRNGVA